MSRSLFVVATMCGVLSLLHATTASAGLPECAGIRLEDARSCEIRGDLKCTASCSELGVYKKACATKLHTVCREDCTLNADASCTDSCTESCSADCDRGVNVICTHNCFRECSGACDAQCKDADDRKTCTASCEATCDGECDIRCAPVIDGSCYKHCIECCGGSCTAQANMTCQTSCQEESFEECEHEVRADCEGSCTGDGALFCDDEFVLSGDQLVPCAQALVRDGIGNLDLEGEVQAGLDDLGAHANASAKASGCSAAPSAGDTGRASLGILALVALAWRARRR